MTERLELRYVDLATLRRWGENAKRHDLGALAESITRHGFRDPPAYDPALNAGEGGIVEGNGRGDALSAMQAQGQSAPRGVVVEGGAWLVPVLFGVDAPSQAAAEAYGVAHNNLTMAGGDFTDLDMAGMWEPEGYAALLRSLAEQGEIPVSIDPTALDALLAGLAGTGEPGAGVAPVEDVELGEAGDVPDLLAPFPWFGGKARVASRMWARLGDVDNYVEPFCGSAAVLLAAPTPPRIVTLNDADGFIANFWRAVAADPNAVARHLDWPVNEIDLFARHVALIRQSGELVRQLEADPAWYDAQFAGWWCWGACAWIGTGWCSGEGPWNIDADGARVNIRGANNAGQGVNRQLPHLGDAGQGVNRQLPHLGDAGQGVNRKLPHLGDAGRGAAITDHLHTYMGALADALRTARVTCGDWARVVTESVTTRHGLTAVVLDPPYGEGAQEYSAGGNADGIIAAAVWAWACNHGDDPQLRIAVCGYDDGRATPPGWTVMRWTARKGYQSVDGESADNPAREAVWFSPHCLERAS